MMKRIEQVRQILLKSELDALYLQSPSDIFYLSSLEASKGDLLISQDQASLFLDGRYLEKGKIASSLPVFPLEELKQTLSLFRNIGFDSLETPYARYQTWKEEFSSVSWRPLNNPIGPLRAIKEAKEIRALQDAAEASWRAYLYVKGELKEGIQEIELLQKLSWFCLFELQASFAFNPIIAFGENSALPHHTPSKRALRRGDPVLIDLGIKKNHYCGDMTRTLFFGPPSPKMKSLFSLVQESYQAAFSTLRSGVTLGEVDAQARLSFEREGLLKQFLHSLGHGIGLCVHESPSFHPKTHSSLLEEGMVLTLEPGLYLPGIGGVRHENMIWIQKEGAVSLFPEEDSPHEV